MNTISANPTSAVRRHADVTPEGRSAHLRHTITAIFTKGNFKFRTNDVRDTGPDGGMLNLIFGDGDITVTTGV